MWYTQRINNFNIKVNVFSPIVWGYFTGFDLKGLFIISVVFVSILLHELGHAVVARRLGLKVRYISIHPLGGGALIRYNNNPKDELWVTVAGLGVSFGIAIVSFLLAFILFPKLFSVIAAFNLAMFLMNILPIYPLDGGRALHSILSMILGEDKTSGVSSRVGGVLSSVIIVISSLSKNWNMLIFGVTFFVMSGLLASTKNSNISYKRHGRSSMY